MEDEIRSTEDYYRDQLALLQKQNEKEQAAIRIWEKRNEEDQIKFHKNLELISSQFYNLAQEHFRC